MIVLAHGQDVILFKHFKAFQSRLHHIECELELSAGGLVF